MRNTYKTDHLQIPEQPTLAAYSVDIRTTRFTVHIKDTRHAAKLSLVHNDYYYDCACHIMIWVWHSKISRAHINYYGNHTHDNII